MLLGLEFDTINDKKVYSLEQFYVTEYFKEKMKYEGVFMQKIKATLEKVDVKVDEDWLILNMNQRKSNLAIEVLEPEAPNSFVSYSVIPTFKGDTLPIYRLN